MEQDNIVHITFKFLFYKHCFNYLLYSCGGNMLLNVGPRHDGIIDPLMQERLAQMGEWMSVNGEAIYGTRPWIYQNDTINPNVWSVS